MPIVATSGSEKARSEAIIYPVLLELRRILNRNVSLFSGEDFNVDEAVGLNGICDFLISRSASVLEIEAPVVVVVEAKKTDLKTGFGQCIAEKQTVTIDLSVYPLPPVEQILGFLVWMVQEG